MDFIGTHSVNLDAKGRLALPARFREMLSQASDGRVTLTIDIRYSSLLLYPQPVWEQVIEKIGNLPNINSVSRRLQHLLIGNAYELELDGSGRLTIPPRLREHAGLEKKLAVVGQREKIEIWAEEAWDDHIKMALADEELKQALETAEFDSISI